jgi:hypothetical protein
LRWDVPGASSETSTPQWPHTKERGNGKSGDLSEQDLGTGQTFRLLSCSASSAAGPGGPAMTPSSAAASRPSNKYPLAPSYACGSVYLLLAVRLATWSWSAAAEVRRLSMTTCGRAGSISSRMLAVNVSSQLAWPNPAPTPSLRRLANTCSTALSAWRPTRWASRAGWLGCSAWITSACCCGYSPGASRNPLAGLRWLTSAAASHPSRFTSAVSRCRVCFAAIGPESGARWWASSVAARRCRCLPGGRGLGPGCRR